MGRPAGIPAQYKAAARVLARMCKHGGYNRCVNCVQLHVVRTCARVAAGPGRLDDLSELARDVAGCCQVLEARDR